MKGLLQEKLLHNDPAFIAPYFAKLPKAITALKKRDVPMTGALKVSETAVADFTLWVLLRLLVRKVNLFVTNLTRVTAAN